MSKLAREFFTRDVLDVAPQLIGKYVCRRFEDGAVRSFQITEVEAYCGESDKACHASKGRTKRTEAFYCDGGTVYVYFIYGRYWLMNIVTGRAGDPQAVLIRGFADCSGPGRAGMALRLDRSFYGEDLVTSPRIWLEDRGDSPDYVTTPRIGIDYAGEPWISKLWRFVHSGDDSRARKKRSRSSSIVPNDFHNPANSN